MVGSDACNNPIDGVIVCTIPQVPVTLASPAKACQAQMADFVEQDEARKTYEDAGQQTNTLAKRIEHVIHSAFDGRRVTIFSGGAAKDTEQVLEEIRGIRDGGGFGSIMGRNAFQRERSEALELLDSVIKVYQGKL